MTRARGLETRDITSQPFSEGAVAESVPGNASIRGKLVARRVIQIEVSPVSWSVNVLIGGRLPRSLAGDSCVAFDKACGLLSY